MVRQTIKGFTYLRTFALSMKIITRTQNPLKMNLFKLSGEVSLTEWRLGQHSCNPPLVIYPSTEVKVTIASSLVQRA